MPTFSVCLEMIYEDRPFLERFEPVAELGTEAVEFWEWEDKDLEAVEAQLEEHDLDLAAFAGTDEPLTDPAQTDDAVAHVERSVEVAERLNCPTVIVLTGDDQPDVSRERQRELVVGGLRDVAPVAEAAGVTLTLEPLNTAVDHPGYFLETAAEGLSIVRDVDSPAVKLLYDVYHQQVTEGNIIQTVTDNVDDIGHVHVADVPGRHEPGHGELAYPNIVERIDAAGYDGYFGFEFRPFDDPDGAVRQALSLQ